MSVSIDIASDALTVIAALFPTDDRGHITFGFARESIDPQSSPLLPDVPVRVRDYMMERFVAYSVRVIASDRGATLRIDDVTDDRDTEVEWFCKKYITSKGLEIIEDSKP